MADTLNEPIKTDYKNQLIQCAQTFGGKNYFLQLLEAIRETRPHPLMAKNAEFHFSMGTIKWKKVIYKDKVHLLLDMLKDNRYNGNLMPRKGDKGYKTKMNLLRTLGPMKFKAQPKNIKDGAGFTFYPFDIIDEKTTRLNPLFDAVFFQPVHTVKKELTS